MRVHYLTGFLSCFCIAIALGNPAADQIAEEIDMYYPYIGERFDYFDWQLCKTLESPDLGNVIVSPISVKLLLAMLKEGSSGSTEKELESILEISNGTVLRERYTEILRSLKSTSKDFILDLGTRFYLDSTMQTQQKYAALLKSSYDTDIYSIDFDKTEEASDEINAWVQNITHDKITHLVNPDDMKEAVLLLVNALYFKGQWRNQFQRNETTMGGFYVFPKQTVTVQYMINHGRYYYTESSDLDAKILRIPFKGLRYSMFLILPHSKAGLGRLIKDISSEIIKRHLRMMESSNVHVILPKFKFDFTTKLAKILQKLGLKQMFQNSASLPKISRGKGNRRTLVVNDVIQKAGIEVNEEGSTIYAATDFVLGNKFGSPDNIFNASSPFLFFVEDEVTGTILFVGKVENPVQIEQLPFPIDATPSRFADKVPPKEQSVLSTGSASFNLDPQPEEIEKYEEKRFNFFDTELLQVVCQTKENENVLISPTSVKIILTMLLEGAYGVSAEEIKTVLRLPSETIKMRDYLASILRDLNDRTDGVTLQIGNRVYINDKLTPKKEFADNLKAYYYSDAKTLNFSSTVVASNTVNEWVNRITNGFIPALLSPDSIRPDTSAMIMNVLFFKGVWTESFEEQATRPACFYIENGDCRMTNMMESVATYDYGAIDDLDAQAVNLGYKGGSYSMLVLLPNKKNKIKQLLRDLSYVPVHKIIEKLSPNEVVVSLPRFQIDYSTDLVPNLQMLNIRDVFTPHANLSGIVQGNAEVYVNSIIHKTKIEVNEKGTTAAAASAAVVVPLMGSTKPRFRADHPFLFFIRHTKTGTVLFSGRVNNPEDATPAPQQQPSRREQSGYASQQRTTPSHPRLGRVRTI